MTNEELWVKIQADAQGVRTGMSDAASAVQSGTQQMEEHFLHVGEIAENISSKISGLFAAVGFSVALEAIENVGRAIERLGGRAAEIDNMSEVLGISVERYQDLMIAADEASTSIEKVARAAESLQRLFVEARDGSSSAREKLLSLGFTLDQITDSGFGTEQMLEVLRERLTNGATATDTMNALLVILGPRAIQAAEAFKKMAENEAEAAQRTAELNGQTKAQLDELKEMKEWWDKVGFAIDGAQSKMLVFFGEAAQWFIRTRVAMDAAFGIKNPMAGLLPEEKGHGASGSWATPAEEAKPSTASEGEIKAIKAAVDAYKEGTLQRVEILQAYVALVTSREGAGSEAAIEGQQKLVRAQEAYAEERARIAGAAARKAATAEREAANERHREATVDLHLKLEEEDKANKEKLRMAIDVAKSREEMALNGIEHAKVLLEADLAQGRITNAQKIETERQLENARFEIALQGARERLEAEKISGDPAAIERAQKAIEILAAKHGTEIARINARAAQESGHYYNQLFDNIKNGMASAVTGVLQGTQSAMQGLLNMVNAIGAGITQMFVNMGLEWARVHIARMLGIKQETAAEAGGAAVAGAKSAAAIPFYGWAIAIGAAAAIFSAMSSYASKSAEGGYDIPTGVNPVTQLHQQEMVLPAPLANAVRGMAGQGGGARPIALQVSAMDAASFERFVHDPRAADAIARSLRRHVRNSGMSLS